MGGVGSSRWGRHAKKRLVEDSLVIDVRTLPGLGTCLHGKPGGVPVTNFYGRFQFGCAGWNIALECGERAVAFQIALGDDIQWQCIPLRLPGENNQQRETCFHCPSDGCESRCRKLYLPHGERLFLCRECHKLTYSKCQRHDPRITRLKRDPDRLALLLQNCDRGPGQISKRQLLIRAGHACLDELEAQLPAHLLPIYESFVSQRSLRQRNTQSGTA